MSTKNKLSDLNNHLFEQLERLNDDDLKGEDLQKEIDRANAMADIGGVIVNNAKVVLAAFKRINPDGDVLPDIFESRQIEIGHKK